MARLRKTSVVLDTARKRFSGLKSITPEADLGPQLTLPIYEGKITAFAGKLDAYNQALAALDDMLNDLESAESDLNEYNRRYLSATEAHYGPDSSEYEMVGGTRTSERKRPKRKGGGGGTPPAS